MEPITVEFTDTDRKIVDSYRNLAAGLSDYLGESFEIVLHSLESLDHSVIEIFNGYHTGRQVGAPITDRALEMLEKIKRMNGQAYSTYFCTNREGEPMKSSTIAIKGEKGRIICLFCINMYLNTPLNTLIGELTPQKLPDAHESENFATDASDMVDSAVAQARAKIYANPNVPHNLKNKEIITELYGKGIFNIKEAVVRTANLLNISKNTVYLHLRNLSAEK